MRHVAGWIDIRPKPLPRMTQRGKWYHKDWFEYAEIVGWELKKAMQGQDFLKGDIELFVTFYFKGKCRCDNSNLLKGWEDIAQKIVFENDRSVKIVHSAIVENFERDGIAYCFREILKEEANIIPIFSKGGEEDVTEFFSKVNK